MKAFNSQTVLFALWLSLPATAQIWQQQTPLVQPPALEDVAMVHDSLRGVTVLFGGGQYSSRFNDTWEWDGSNWSRNPVAPTTSPSARSHHKMVFDSNRNVVVLHGGHDGSSRLNDTWEFNGVTWQAVLTTIGNSPPTRQWFAMAYDAARREVVMYGGNFTTSAANETWTYDGLRWNVRLPAVNPGYRDLHTMVYDASRGVTLLISQPRVFQPEHWEWDGVSWRTAAVAMPAFNDPVACYDSIAQRVVVFDPRGTGGNWEFTGHAWVLRNPVQQPAARSAAMAFDSNRGVSVLYGGVTLGAPQNETWTYDSNNYPASVSSAGSGCGQPALASSATGSLPILGQSFTVTVDDAPTGTAFLSLGLSDTNFQNFNLPVSLTGYQMPGCWLYQDNLAFLFCPSVAPQTAQLVLPIPANRALLSLRFFTQAFAQAPAANAAGLISSNQLVVTVGS